MIARVWRGYTKPAHADVYGIHAEARTAAGPEPGQDSEEVICCVAHMATRWSSSRSFSGTRSMTCAPSREKTTRSR